MTRLFAATNTILLGLYGLASIAALLALAPPAAAVVPCAGDLALPAEEAGGDSCGGGICVVNSVNSSCSGGICLVNAVDASCSGGLCGANVAQSSCSGGLCGINFLRSSCAEGICLVNGPDATCGPPSLQEICALLERFLDDGFGLTLCAPPDDN